MNPDKTTSGQDALHDQRLRCSFCNKARDDVRRLIAGPNVSICDECVEMCADVFADDYSARQPVEPESEMGLVFTCALCRMPTTSDDALLVPERGPLCPGCLGEIEAAAAKKRSEERS